MEGRGGEIERKSTKASESGREVACVRSHKSAKVPLTCRFVLAHQRGFFSGSFSFQGKTHMESDTAVTTELTRARSGDACTALSASRRLTKLRRTRLHPKARSTSGTCLTESGSASHPPACNTTRTFNSNSLLIAAQTILMSMENVPSSVHIQINYRTMPAE